jgi:starch phosphorylase
VFLTVAYLGLHRSSSRYERKAPTDWLLRLHQEVEVLSRKHPRLGYRKLTRLVRAQGWQVTPQFSANRSVREYTEQHYLPAAENYRSRTAKNGVLGKQMVEGRHRLEKDWSSLRFGKVKVETRDAQQSFEVQVFFGHLDPQAVRVELYANGMSGEACVRQEMELSAQKSVMAGMLVYSANVSSDRPSSDYTARLTPRSEGVAVPLEEARILWQR